MVFFLVFYIGLLVMERLTYKRMKIKGSQTSIA